ncbi:MAG: hypothetical protein ABL961_05575 [Vicinamibacterales bacterium]
MTTNTHGHTVWNLTNRVMAVIDDAGKAQAAVDSLERAGVPEHELAALSGAEGIHEIDADGSHGAAVKQALRALQSVTTEGTHLRHYEAELAQGHLVVDVTVHGRQKRDTVVQVLRSCGAHFINAYGPWTIESVAA